PATQFLDKPLSAINFLIDDEPSSVDGTDLGFFYAPLPILKNISFVSALTPRQILGYLENIPEAGVAIKAFDLSLDALAGLNDFVKAVNASPSGGDVWINFGSFDITQLASKETAKGEQIGDKDVTQTKTPDKDGEAQAKDDAGSEDSAGSNLLQNL